MKLRPIQVIVLLLGLGLGGLLLSNLVGARSASNVPSSAQPGPTYVEAQRVGDFDVVLTIDPVRVGDSLFRVRLLDATGTPVTDAREVTLTLELLDHAAGSPVLNLTPQPNGGYELRANSLTVAGRWRAVATVQGGKGNGLSGIYTVIVGPRVVDTASGQPLFPYRVDMRNFGLRTVLGLELAVLGLAMVLAAAWLARFAPFRRSGMLLGLLGVVLGSSLAVASVLSPLAPGEYLQNPTPNDPASIARGRPVFMANCAVCHGPAGRGDGPQAKALNPPPADLAGGHISVHTDEDLFFWATNGIDGTAMPGFKDKLKENERWDVINFVRSLALATQ